MSTFKIATWNVNSLRVRLPMVLDWLSLHQPDVLALQETKMTDAEFPAEAIRNMGYQVCYSGQKTYNGVAMMARQELTDIVTGFAGFEDAQKRLLAATVAGYRLINVYIPNGSEVGSGKYAYKLDWLEHLKPHVHSELKTHETVVLMGDFNIAPEDRDVYDPVAWRDKLLCTPAERAVFAELLQLGMVDAFRLFEQPENSYSWWDYRMQAFRRKMGLRIDHILVSQTATLACQRCYIDIEPRRLERPSDHAPVVLELASSQV